MRPVFLIGLLACSVAATGCVDGRSVTSAMDSAVVAKLEPLQHVPPHPLQWGLYQILWSRDYGRHLEEELSHFASRPGFVMFYRDLGRPFPTDPVDAIVAAGAVPIISLELWSWHGPRGAYLPRIVAGDLDEFFRQWARDARADGRRVLLRFGFEANGDWFSWGGDPEAYVQAWRHAYGLFQQEGAHNVQWVWSPNVVSVPDTPANDLHRYYPGDEYVSWVGLDGYNWGPDHDAWHGWETFEEIFGVQVSELARRYPDKPIMVAETGCAPDEAGRKARWTRQAWRAAQRMPGLDAVVWFNHDKRREGELDWRIASSPESLEAFNATFAAPRDS